MTKQTLRNTVLFIIVFLAAAISLNASATIKKKTMTVDATAYNSVPGQTDSNPWIAAWNNRLRPGDKIIAVSRDLEKHGLTNGAKVKIEGLPGIYTVRDRMNKRFRRRIDVWMGKDVKKARRWGKKKLKITWHPAK
ncbi:3D domain-containing protein [Microbulbifer thermotolerans]|uniref:3D domain-containing protein n=1 Tax=Microbulbifer thermotolerans TaxID=252514 RepID=UPI0008F377DF|nr:3D domain-containing protein [Microbulbifer thermotolerans]MCX2779497.1 3D domain-containing protein [Microbulbifer thermotolerans]MCX2793368.1 3D domain-containing protein [Microbulbifer thermotolerans]MCX2806058.1 3D domain-containing protein [Microbulbifer thermotolerans]SFC84031.1 3D (Asp-Asp-Asp) domain-containing protein [Microbulbifer thermotolerans]